MNKDDFLLRTVTVDGEYGVSATRTRTSNGFSVLKIVVERIVSNAKGEGVKKTQQIVLDSDDFGAEYEQAAREVVSVLDEICNDTCTLPKGNN